MPETSQILEFRSSPIHGKGGFARVAIPAGARVIEYLGEPITKAESVRRCAAGQSAIFHLDDARNLDGGVDWNPARLLNHSCAPNCDVELEDGRLWVVTRRAVERGEEITFNYGYDLEGVEEHPCRCGASDCVGFIVAEEFQDMVRRRQQWKLK